MKEFLNNNNNYLHRVRRNASSMVEDHLSNVTTERSVSMMSDFTVASFTVSTEVPSLSVNNTLFTDNSTSNFSVIEVSLNITPLCTRL